MVESRSPEEDSGNGQEDSALSSNASPEPSLREPIDQVVHRILDIEECALEYIQKASARYNEEADKLKNELSQEQKNLSDDKPNSHRLLALRSIRSTIRQIDRHNKSSPVRTLEQSLFIHLFAAFDKYIGDLVLMLYQHNQDLYKNINREIALSEALKYDSMDALRHAMLDKEIEAIRRKSYTDQFKDLENRFSITLTKFDEWPYFVERAQRRNLFTHCDGVVSAQYLEICRSVGCKFKEQKQIGQRLDIGAKYFFHSCLLVAQVAIMLGQTLWRKVIPGQIDKADLHLVHIIFHYLSDEKWAHAISLSKFALSLPRVSTDEVERIFTVNYAIALKAINKGAAAKKILDKKDWTATTYDFKLAYAVLSEKYADAEELMKKIGKQGELSTSIEL
ncbi:MAG TPA: hypothetical protein DIW77_18660, partial [Chromatiaceae bacterium]|nr:hypothetical protein [Chromatiaceae bacterium]